MKRIALLLPILSGTCWGSAGVFVRVLYEAGFDNITITFSRLVITALLLMLTLLVYDRGLFRIRAGDLPFLAICGISGYVFMNICYNVAINLLSMSLASILLCTAPVFVIILGSILFHEKITRIRVLCMLGALVGCFLLSGILDTGGLKWSVYGLLMGVGASLSNAAYVLSSNELADKRKVHPLTVTFYTCSLAVLLMIPLADHHMILQFVADRPGTGVIFMVAHAVVVSLLPNLSYTVSMKYADAGVVSILASGAEPTSALLFGLFLYAEIPTVPGVIGMIIVVVSIIVLTRSDSDCA